MAIKKTQIEVLNSNIKKQISTIKASAYTLKHERFEPSKRGKTYAV